MTDRREIVITGAGLVTPLGIGVEENWARMKGMETGLACIGETPISSLRCRGAVREFGPLQDIPSKLRGQVKFLNRGSVLGFEAAREAFSMAGADMSDVPQGRRALFIAGGDTTQVGCTFMHEALKDASNGVWDRIDAVKLNESSLCKVNPFFLLESILNNLFSTLSAFLECMGPNTTLGNDSPCGGNALELAARSIESNTSDVAVVVGCGTWITDIPMYEMASLGLLSACADGVRSFRPFDRQRDGFIAGEGGAALFLETSERAKQRGAKVLARLTGFGNCSGRPNAASAGIADEVSADSMQTAMKEAGISPQDCAFVCCHGSASRAGDRSELTSVSRVFGGPAAGIPVCGLKPYTGHLGAASDIAEIIFSMKAVAEGVVPATLHFQEPDEEFREFVISGTHGTTDRRSFLSVSCGVTGQSSSVAVEVPAG